MDTHSLTTSERAAIKMVPSVEGWGADLEREVRPGVPRDKAPNIGVEALYPDFEMQIPTVKIHRSIEHMRMTPVFGTSCPPTGLSGMIRDYAYRFSEGRFRHWLLLLFADRVNVAEDLINDLSHGRVPNLYKEMGLAAEWKYNRKNVIRNMAIGVIGASALFGVARMIKVARRTSRSEVEAT